MSIWRRSVAPQKRHFPGKIDLLFFQLFIEIDSVHNVQIVMPQKVNLFI